MSSKIDSLGTYLGEIVESGLGTTKNGYPQWVARLKATKKWIESAADMKHFQITEPAWVDWSSFGEEIVAYLVLFNNKDEFSKETALLNYEQLQLATGWDGTEFDSVATFAGKTIQFRVQDKKPYTNPTTGKVSEGGIEVGWIDNENANPERQLKVLDAAGIKGLSAKLKIAKVVKPAAPAKPAPAVSTPKPAPTPAPMPAAPVVAPAPAPAAPKAPKKKAAPAPVVVPDEPAAPVDEKPALPKEVSQTQAWEYLVAHKGGNEDGAIEDAWIAATNEVGPDKDGDSFTNQEWGRVRDIVIRDLSL
jgi:outer membrane biosynthesis protein TonB